MGCCVTIQPSYKLIDNENSETLQKKTKILCFNHPKIMREIFSKKDSIVPQLNLESNKFRNSRLKINKH